ARRCCAPGHRARCAICWMSASCRNMRARPAEGSKPPRKKRHPVSCELPEFEVGTVCEELAPGDIRRAPQRLSADGSGFVSGCACRSSAAGQKQGSLATALQKRVSLVPSG